MIQKTIELAMSVAFMVSVCLGANQAYHWIKVETVKKIHQGLPSLSKMTQTMTGKKFDKNFNLIPIKRGHQGN